MGATNFKKARKNLKLTQKQVGEKIGITENSYARIERGVAKPSYDTLKAICRVLKLELPFKA